MAIIFQSPKKKQRMFFLLIIGLLVVLLVVVALITFLPELNNRFKDFSGEDTMSIPEIRINFAVIDSQQTQSLILFKPVEIEFTYTAKNTAGRQVAGRISANDIQEAGFLLENTGLSEYVLREVVAGRQDPFTAY
ncbi:MAG: hypothetical protein EXS52_01340 [Candidatus Staskawiczbacteria bacterium]|nr:hypothetical protein [Candidatus Staskawiczbacteria bacterium]